MKLGNLAEPENHYYDFGNETTYNFKFVVFSDPQYGKYDIKLGVSEGTVWDEDIERTVKMCEQINQLENISFIMSAGDLAEAFPTSEKPELGSQAALRPAQTLDFLISMSWEKRFFD